MTAADLTILAFAGERLIARGLLADAMPSLHAAQFGGEPLLVLDAATGKAIDLDLRGSADEARGRLADAPEVEKRGPGRPKLGVTAREVTLLPRHWDWLAAQPGGASVALRKLVEGALKEAGGPDRARQAKEATYRLMTTLAGDRSGYEDATRMLFAGDWTAFDTAIVDWPADIRAVVTETAESGWRNGAGRPA